MLNRKFGCRTASVLALAICAASAASATEKGFYLGIDYGQSMFDVEDGELGIFDVTTASNTDDKDSTFSIAAGYRFNPNFALELAYMDLGQVTITEDGRDLVTPVRTGHVEGSVGSTGISLALIGTLPVNKWEFFAKLGVLMASTDLDVSVTLVQGGITQSGSDGTSADTTETIAGLGIGYSFTDHFFVKLEWDTIPKLGDENETGEGDVSRLSLGVQYRF